MKERWMEMERRKKWILLAILLSVLILTAYAVFCNLPGLRLAKGFLYEKGDGVWRGNVLSEAMTVTRQGRELHLSRAGLEKIYRMDGEPGHDSLLVILEDGKEVYRGYYVDGLFLDENREFQFGSDFIYSYSTTMDGVRYVRNGVEISVEEAMLDLPHGDVVRLLTDGSPDTRGEGWMVIPAAVLLVIAFVFLWCPLLSFRLRMHRHQFWVYRGVSGDEPSDWYYVQQKISIAMLIIAAVVLLGMGLLG